MEIDNGAPSKEKPSAKRWQTGYGITDRVNEPVDEPINGVGR